MSYMGPQLPDGGFATMVRNVVVKLMSEQREPEHVINAACYEIDGHMGNIQARCAARASMDGSTGYTTVQEEVRAWLWQNLAGIKERIAYQQQMQMQQHYGGQMPYGAGYPQPMYPAMQPPVQQMYASMPQQPTIGQSMGQFGGYPQQAPPMGFQQQTYDPSKSAYQNPHHASIITTGVKNYAAELINEAHNSTMNEAQMYGNQGFQQPTQTLNSFAASTGAGVFQTNPAQVNAQQQFTYPQQQQPQQQQPQEPVQRVSQEEIDEYKNPKQPKMKPRFFATQKINTVTEKIKDAKVETYNISDESVVIDEISSDVATYEMASGVSGDTAFSIGKVEYKVPSLNPTDVFGSMKRLLPNTFPLKRPYFIEVRYPELRAKFLGRPLSEGGLEKIIDIYDFIRGLGKDLSNGDIGVSEAMFELHSKLTASTDIDRRVGEYLHKFLLEQINQKMLFNLGTNKDAAGFFNAAAFKDLGLIAKFDEFPDFPKDLKERYTPYGDDVRKSVIDCITTTFSELINPLTEELPQGMTLSAWDPIIDINDTSHSLFSFLKHPEVSPAIAELIYTTERPSKDTEESIVIEEDGAADDLNSELVDMSSIREDLERYFFHLVTKRVIITNIEDIGFDSGFMGSIINTRMKYQHGIYQAFLNNNLYGTVIPILSIDKYGDCINKYALGQNLDDALLIMKSTDY